MPYTNHESALGEIIHHLGDIGKTSADVFAVLNEASKEEDEGIRESAIVALGKRGEEAVPNLLALLNSDYRSCDSIIDSLSLIPIQDGIDAVM